MTLEEAKALGDRNLFTNRTLYAGFLYFYKREITQDHYFTIEGEDNTLYKLIHHKDNYNEEVTPTGKSADSFKINFEEYLEADKIVIEEEGRNVKEEFLKEVNDNTAYLDRDQMSAKIDRIMMLLLEMKSDLLNNK